MKKATRRQVLVGGAAVAASGCFPDVGGQWAVLKAECEDESQAEPASTPSRVAEVHREDAVTLDPATRVATIAALPVREMLEATLKLLYPAGAPWRAILPDWTAETRIGIKVNVLNPRCPTSPELTRAIVDSLVEELGASRERIIVWDRGVGELTAAGITEDAVGAKVLGTLEAGGYAPSACGVVAGAVPLLSRILTEHTDVTINVPVLKTHAICGVTGAMKNIYGIISNPGDYHTNLNEALPQLYRLPPIRRHLRFHVLDALVAITRGSTSSPRDSVPRRVLASADPLALDRRALALTEELREEFSVEMGLELKPLDRGVMGWMDNAHLAGLGSLEFELSRA